MVWTSETGIFEVAYELSRWPSSWNTDKGSAVRRTSIDGFRRPFLRAGTLRLSDGNTEAAVASTRHQNETDANCMIVSVAGLSNAFSMDFEDVLVRADVIYHVIHSPYTVRKTTPATRITYNEFVGDRRFERFC